MIKNRKDDKIKTIHYNNRLERICIADPSNQNKIKEVVYKQMNDILNKITT